MPNEALTPAATVAAKASRPYPNDSAAYRKARTALLAEEIELRRQIERVAAQRRALPPCGEIPQDYAVTAADGRRVRLSELFGDKDTLVTFFWMFGPERARPCPMCTAFLGCLDGNARDIEQRVALAIVGRSPIERQKAFKQERGWRALRLYATTDVNEGEAFAKDYRGLVEHEEGALPGGLAEVATFNVFHRDADGTIRRSWSDEMGFETADPGQDPRAAPDPLVMWTIFDMTPEGRDPEWIPSLEYPERR
jgi:predicted dithiol-disulfide oxidoreductase (DUF899 family)